MRMEIHGDVCVHDQATHGSGFKATIRVRTVRQGSAMMHQKVRGSMFELQILHRVLFS